MRKVSQKWIENQDKTLRDQGLLRLDFLSAHNNNAKANIIPMGSDSNYSDINYIKDISPYGAPNKNLAIPDLTGKTEISAGVYRLYDGDGITLDYNIFNGIYHINGVLIGSTRRIHRFPLSIEGNYNISYHYVSGSLSSGSLEFSRKSNESGLPISTSNYTQNRNVTRLFSKPSSDQLDITVFGGSNYVDLAFKLQLEKGDTATDYEIPQANTGYVSTAIANPDGTLTPAGSNYYTIDQPIAELNGHSLREVFEDNNKYLATLNASDYEPAVPNWATITNEGNDLKVTRGSADTIFYGNRSTYDMTLNNGSLYYLATYIKSNVSANLRISLRQSATGVQDSNVDVGLIGSIYGIKSRIATITNYLNAKVLQFQITNSNVNIEIYHNAIKVIDLTSLGISHLTVEQMDYWFSVYQAVRVVPIEVNVEDYRSPLNGLTITWSENFGHAVDYSIEYNGEIYTYLNNTKKTVFVPIIVENTPDANFKIRVHKWSQGGVPIRIERVFVGLHSVYKQDKIFSFNKKKYNNVLGLELPQDQINFELSNLDRMFDPLWYNSYFKYLNEKTEIRAYSGFKYGTNGEEWIKQGTYYLTDWKAPNNSLTATFTARDILNLLDADEMYSKDIPLTLDEYCDIILGRDYKGVDDYVPYDLPVNPDGTKKWNMRKNLAMPDVTGKPEISAGVYRIFNNFGLTVDYNITNGHIIINGSFTGEITFIFKNNVVEVGSTYITSIHKVSGTSYSNSRPLITLGNSATPENSIAYNLDSKVLVPTGTNISFYMGFNGFYDNLTFKLQVEQGSTATDYEIPIENANIPVLKETVNKREALQLIAQSIGCHIKVDDNGDISFIRETYGKQIDVPKKILLTKPEFNLGAPVKKIIVPYSKYNPDPNELEVAKIDVSAGDIVELNHDTPYFNGHGTHTTGSATLQSTDMTWYRSFKAVIGGTGTGQLIVMREPVIKSSVNVIQDISSSGDTLTYENNLIDTQLKASRAIGKIWGEIDNSREVEFELRIDPRIDTFNVVSFPFRVLNLEQVEYMRVDELELTFNGSYKGKVKGVILSNYGGDLTPKTYVRRSDDFKSGEENLKWHLLSE